MSNLNDNGAPYSKNSVMSVYQSVNRLLYHSLNNIIKLIIKQFENNKN